MRHYDRTANLFLKRRGFYADCTVGELYDEEGKLICHTLEPPYRPSGERTVVGNTAIPDGIYPLKMEYDTVLRYKCLRAADVRGFKNIRLCFIAKAHATANQTKGNILLGSRVSEEEGRLDDCIAAFEKLNAYYEAKRCNHSQLCVQVSCEGFNGRSSEPFCKAQPKAGHAIMDYELNTL